MKKLFGLLFALAIVVGLLFIVGKDVLIEVALAKRPENIALAKRPEHVAHAKRSATSQIVSASTPPPIVSISVCSPDSHDGMLQQGSCDPGTFDTHQPVLDPNGVSVNSSTVLGAGIGAAPDEHSSIFTPGTLGTNQDYLFFLANGLGGNAHIGVSVLSGGAGPDQFGRWTLNFSTTGYSSYGNEFGPVFNPSTKSDICPATPDNLATEQDETFDMHYASAGSIVKDPTAAPGSLLMVYEGTNACVGNPGGPISGNDNDYISLGIATSIDYGKTWPTYRGNPLTFDFVPLPGVNTTQAPNAPMGALWPNVCMGNNCCVGADCAVTPPAGYGRYPVVTPTTSLDTLMKEGVPLPNKYGEQEISGFVDDVSPNAAPYLYASSGNVRLAKAALNGGSAPLTFTKWDGQGFNSAGLGGTEASVLPTDPNSPFENCLDPTQKQFGSSITYVEATHQYLLTFVCISSGDPKLGKDQAGAQGGASWFYATSYNLNDPTQWSKLDALGNPQPREIAGSWSPFDASSTTCPDFKGWYPSFMSLKTNPGHLSMSGYVFYLYGCQGGGNGQAPQRQMSSRAFKITTTDTTPPVTTSSIAGPLGLNGWYTGATTVTFTATDDLSGVATTEYSLDNGASWTTGTNVSLTKSAIYNILYHSIDVDENAETPKSITVNLDSRPPAITESASPSIIYNNVRVVSVTVSGTINDNLSGVDPTTAQFAVHDEYGRVQPSGPVTIASDGSYSFTVALRTFVRATDTDGRQYTIHVSAADNAGNKRTTETVVTAKRFKLLPPPPCGSPCI